MRILYLSQYFPPEIGATQTRAYEMAQNWVRLGHTVTVLTEIPNHPSGIIPKAYKRKIIERTILDGIDVIRVWVKASPVKNFKNRMFFYLSYMINSILTSIFLITGKYDFIYATSPPLFVGGAALAIRYIKYIPMVFEVRDLWPETAIALGELTSRKAIKLATMLEETCYRNAIKIVVVTQGIHNRLVERGISPKKIILIPNGANVSLFKYQSDARARIRADMNLGNKFVVIYAGIFGLAQGLETIIEAARILIKDSDIHFLLIGDGPKKEELLTLVAKYNLPNVTILPEQPREIVSDYISAADIAVVPLKKAEIFKGALPSKIFDSWACMRPVLISIDGEARQVVEEAHGGIYIPPEDPIAMARSLSNLKDLPDYLKQMGMNGLTFTQKHFSRQALAEKLITYLSSSFEK